MAKAARFRAMKLQRRKPSRDPRARITLICEGKNSEPLYFSALAKVLQNSVIDPVKGGGTPDAIAETAIEIAKRSAGRRKVEWFEKADQIWAVFDRDEHEHYDAAVQRCEQNGIKLARSNPCFEVWLILHVEDFQRPDGRADVLSHFCKLKPEYKEGKGRKFDFVELTQSIQQAEDRAENQLAQRAREGHPFGPPCTTVFELTRMLRQRG